MTSFLKTFVFLTFISFSIPSNAWGPTGHRVVGEIAYQHLSKKARKKINLVLNGESLAMCSTWMDNIKSDRSYDSLSSWHYVTIPVMEKYHHEGEGKGDVLQAINRFKNELETGNYSVDEAFALKSLVHLVGDVHQPLHVGNGEDRGGNDVKVKWFGKSSNLHRVWDSEMIDGQKLSYTEYTNWINVASKDQISKWETYDLNLWAEESIAMRASVYDYPESKKLGYQYSYNHIQEVNQRLLQAGIRLAGILNEIYG